MSSSPPTIQNMSKPRKASSDMSRRERGWSEDWVWDDGLSLKVLAYIAHSAKMKGPKCE